MLREIKQNQPTFLYLNKIKVLNINQCIPKRVIVLEPVVINPGINSPFMTKFLSRVMFSAVNGGAGSTWTWLASKVLCEEPKFEMTNLPFV